MEKKMKRLFRVFHPLKNVKEVGELVSLSSEESKHLKVRRVEKGEEIELWDGSGTVAVAKVESFNKQVTSVKIEEIEQFDASKFSNYTVCTAIPQGERSDFMFEKLTELGVNRIVPLLLNRSSTSEEFISKKAERWKNIVISASKQCYRPKLPILEPPSSLKDLLSRKKGEDEWVYGALEGEILMNHLSDIQYDPSTPFYAIIVPLKSFILCEMACISSLPPFKSS